MFPVKIKLDPPSVPAQLSASFSAASSSDIKISDTAFTVFSTVPSLSSLEFSSRREELSADDAIDSMTFFKNFNLKEIALEKHEIEHIKNLFKTYKTGNHCCLFDLLAMHFFSLINQFRPYLESHEEILMKFPGEYLILQQGIYRSSLGKDSWEEGITDQFFHKPIKSLLCLRNLSKQITDQIKDDQIIEKISVPLEITAKSAKKKHKARQKAELHMMCESLETGLRLLNKLVLHPESNSLLFEHTLADLPGSQEMLLDSIEQLPQTLKIFETYLETLTMGFKYLAKIKMVCSPDFETSIKQKLFAIQNLLTINDLNELKEEIKSLIKEQANETSSINSYSNTVLTELQEARKGMLNHQMWCRRHGIVAARPKSDKVFIEDLYMRFFQTSNLAYIITDCKTLLEVEILRFLDPDFSTSFAHLQRMKQMANLLTEESIAFLKRENLCPSMKKTQERFFTNLSRYRKYEGEPLISYLANMEAGDVYATAWLDQPAINSFCDFLSQEIDRCLSDFLFMDNSFSEKISYWEQTAWLAQAFVFLHDLRVILGKIEPDTSDLEIFPEHFLLKLHLDQHEKPIQTYLPIIYEFPSDQLEAVTEVLAPEEQLFPNTITSRGESSSSKSELLEEGLPSSQILNESRREKKYKQKQERALKHKKSSSSKMKEEETESPSSYLQFFENDPHELLQVRKLRDVKSVLRKLGLEPIRTKGDHEMWVHKQNPQSHATLPYQSEIRRGTLQSIFKQVTGQQTGLHQTSEKILQ